MAVMGEKYKEEILSFLPSLMDLKLEAKRGTIVLVRRYKKFPVNTQPYSGDYIGGTKELTYTEAMACML